MSFDGAKIHFFPDIPAVSAEILALRGWEGEKMRAAVRLPWRSEPPSLGLVQSDLKSDCCEYQDLQSAISHFKCLYSLRSDSCVPSVASQHSWSGKSDRAEAERLVPVLPVAPLTAERLVPGLQVAPLAAERYVPVLQVAPLTAERHVPVLQVASLTAERHPCCRAVASLSVQCLSCFRAAPPRGGGRSLSLW